MKKRKTRHKQPLSADLVSYFSFLGGAQMLEKKYGEKYLKKKWAEHGRAFLDNWQYDKPPLILKIFGEPETLQRRFSNAKYTKTQSETHGL